MRNISPIHPWCLCFLWCLVSFPVCGQAIEEEITLVDFSEGSLPDNLKPYGSQVSFATDDRGQALRVEFQKTDWPQIFFQGPESGWDWSDSLGLEFLVTNPEEEAFEAAIRVDNVGAPDNSNTASESIPPGETVPLRCDFVTQNDTPFWGMRGVPGRGPLPRGDKIDTTKIVAYQLFLPEPDREHTLLVHSIRLYGDSSIAREKIELPFVDRFGQYKHEEWAQKIHSVEELKEANKKEEEFLEAHPRLTGRDPLGAWAEGGAYDSTGWFRTQRVDGRWWLISPDGRLFFSNGIDCVGLWQRTFIEGRNEWFDWIPEATGEFKPMFGYAKNVHSMAEAIGGEGRTFGFYQVNAYRKYGEDYAREWRNRTYRRFASWGVNTVGNWSAADVLENSPLPFVASAGVSGKHRRIEGGEGYWGKMHDVFDPEFVTSVGNGLKWATEKFSNNPLCIGYFVDNEVSWGNDDDCSIAVWSLRSPPDQPCRIAIIEDLRSKYETLDHLNQAWGTNAKSWDDLRTPGEINADCREDLNSFIHKFCEKYFETLANQVKANAPNQLYLGCRFSGYTRIAVEACAKFADVISFNIYRTTVDPEAWKWLEEIDKPAMIGEFHFGALDRGMFHPGLVEAPNQAGRGEFYERYVRSVAKHPNFVGCHWFQYIDEPITGRTHDGENYNIGFVDVTDTPYRELVHSAQMVHSEVYNIRSSESANP
ncbi:MAG: beta-galactosidase [Candidatus Omnitrophica bacterium]|nr:beta-galactosidase [Candidatus Omnitrophota bacterium]